MKKVLFILIAGMSFVACKTNDKKVPGIELSKDDREKAIKDSANFTSIQWIDSTYKDLGQINEGKQVEVAYRFKNSGTKNLVISDVTASCGCTIPEKPEKAFAPGEDGIIKAKFDSRDKKGEVRKSVYVTANTNPNSQELIFRAEIITDKK